MRCRLLLLGLMSWATACQRLDDGEALEPTSLGDGGSGSGGDDGGTFLPADDSGGDDTGPSGMPSGACDPVVQSGCATGEKCTVIAQGSGPEFVCVGSGGSALQPYDPCQAQPTSGLDACPAGTACIGTTSSGVCLPLCERDADCESGVCGADPVNDFPYCADDCSPFESLCTSPLTCRRNADRFSCEFLQEQDVGGALAACDTTNDAGCAAGFACISGSLVPDCTNPGCCTSLCDLSGADPCSAPATCNAALESPAPGFAEIGACFVPA